MSQLEVNLAPGLLVSMPQLNDPFFGRAVVLMIEHDDGGSFGLIVNNESDLKVPRLLKALELSWSGDPDKFVWSGGPVMPSSGWVLHETIEGLEVEESKLEDVLERGKTLRVTEDLCLSSSIPSLKVVAEATPDACKFLLGYSGWGAGQLASEMAAGSWLHADVDMALLFETPADEIWAASLKSIGVDPEAVIQTRGIH